MGGNVTQGTYLVYSQGAHTWELSYGTLSLSLCCAVFNLSSSSLTKALRCAILSARGVGAVSVRLLEIILLTEEAQHKWRKP